MLEYRMFVKRMKERYRRRKKEKWRKEEH
jgi:hypothetical protein